MTLVEYLNMCLLFYAPPWIHSQCYMFVDSLVTCHVSAGDPMSMSNYQHNYQWPASQGIILMLRHLSVSSHIVIVIITDILTNYQPLMSWEDQECIIVVRNNFSNKIKYENHELDKEERQTVLMVTCF